MGNASALAGLLLLFGAASPAHAQTATVEGAYQRLSPGNAKIARALYDAQTHHTTSSSTTTGTGTTTSKTLTMDQIAAMKNGQGWGQVFQSMKAQGLVADKNLGQVVSRYERSSTGGKKADDAEVSASYDGNRNAARTGSGNSGKTK